MKVVIPKRRYHRPTMSLIVTVLKLLRWRLIRLRQFRSAATLQWVITALRNYRPAPKSGGVVILTAHIERK